MVKKTILDFSSGETETLISAALKAIGYKVRFNQVSLDTELWTADNKIRVERTIDNRQEFSLLAAIERQCRLKAKKETKPFACTQRQWLTGFNAVATANSYHPTQEIVKKISEVDSLVSCPALELFSPVTDWLVNDKVSEGDVLSYYEKIFWHFMVGLYRRVVTPGCQHDTVYVLGGCQGVGKNTFFRHVLHDPDYYNDSLNLTDDPKEIIANMQGSHINMINEMAGLSNAESDRLKAIITVSVDEIRAAYERRKQRYPRQGVLVGSTNRQEPLPYDEEHRRWHFMQIDFPENLKGNPSVKGNKMRDRIISYWDRNRDVVWGRAKYLANHGFDYALSDAEYRTQERVGDQASWKPLAKILAVEEAIREAGQKGKEVGFSYNDIVRCYKNANKTTTGFSRSIFRQASERVTLKMLRKGKRRERKYWLAEFFQDEKDRGKIFSMASKEKAEADAANRPQVIDFTRKQPTPFDDLPVQ